MPYILLVDDDEVSSFLANTLIERTVPNWHVDSVNNGAQALDYLKNNFASDRPMPDIIFLDLNMPILDGFGFLEAFTKLTIPYKEKIKIIIISSSLDHKDKTRAKNLGACEFITKPLTSHLIQGLLG